MGLLEDFPTLTAPTRPRGNPTTLDKPQGTLTQSVGGLNTITRPVPRDEQPPKPGRAPDPASYAAAAAVGVGQRRRPGDPRMRNSEAWRQARERRERFFRTSTRSEQCINKNRERFERQKEEAEDPYPELKRDVEVTNDYLKTKSFVLYTVDISPSRDAVLDWAEIILHQEMGIRVETWDEAGMSACTTPVCIIYSAAHGDPGTKIEGREADRINSMRESPSFT
ncbi:hypothetical protein R1sor_001995 [Riccia sorocarpa]|uniref:Phosducin thioredoxin-like domain-containing protein n=1 Tax=Riccia sorocarpa TaxID=122646 RepID=A0ABD3GXI4_9MARC